MDIDTTYLIIKIKMWTLCNIKGKLIFMGKRGTLHRIQSCCHIIYHYCIDFSTNNMSGMMLKIDKHWLNNIYLRTK